VAQEEEDRMRGSRGSPIMMTGDGGPYEYMMFFECMASDMHEPE
jgi:hypothetical protein